jgi:hypothetical protein
MKPTAIAGILLIIVGVIGLAYGGISYTREKTVVDIGPLKATTNSRETIPLPPAIGAVALVGGILLMLKK